MPFQLPSAPSSNDIFDGIISMLSFQRNPLDLFNRRARSGNRQRSPASALLSGLRPLGTYCPKSSSSLYSLSNVPMRDIVADAQNRFYDLERSGANPLTGVWRKDRKASDCMDEACEMVALPWIFRKALLVLNTLQIEDTQSYFKTTMKAGGLMDVVEKYPWSGDHVGHGRRDKRRGKHIGRVIRTTEGHPCIEVTWDDPYGGHCTDEFRLLPGGHVLEQITIMKVKDKQIQYTTVFRKAIR